MLDARDSVFKDNVPMMGRAFVMGSDLATALELSVISGGSGDATFALSMGADGREMLTRSGIPIVRTNQMAGGGSANQGKDAQGLFAAWGNTLFATWDVMRMWTSQENTMTVHVHALSLYKFVVERPQTINKITVTTS